MTVATPPAAGLCPVDRPTWLLRAVLAGAILESIVHYTDNVVRWSDYTGGQQGIIYRWMIPTSWVLFTVAGVLGYRAFRAGAPRAAGLLGAYSASGLISFGHFISWSVGDHVIFNRADLDAFALTFVWLDVAFGTAILAVAIRLALHPRAPAPSAVPAPTG